MMVVLPYSFCWQITLHLFSSNSMVPAKRPKSCRETRLINIRQLHLPASQRIKSDTAGKLYKPLLLAIVASFVQQLNHSLIEAPLHVLTCFIAAFQVIVIRSKFLLVNYQVETLAARKSASTINESISGCV